MSVCLRNWLLQQFPAHRLLDTVNGLANRRVLGLHVPQHPPRQAQQSAQCQPPMTSHRAFFRVATAYVETVIHVDVTVSAGERWSDMAVLSGRWGCEETAWTFLPVFLLWLTNCFTIIPITTTWWFYNINTRLTSPDHTPTIVNSIATRFARQMIVARTAVTANSCSVMPENGHIEESLHAVHNTAPMTSGGHAAAVCDVGNVTPFSVHVYIRFILPVKWRQFAMHPKQAPGTCMIVKVRTLSTMSIS